MKKNLIALAVAGALAVPAAAMADATIYGKFHVSIDSYDNGGNGAAEASGLSVSSNSSRLGFKGSEDLGNGLSAIWQTESTIGVDGDGSGLSNRNTYVGFKGGFGTVMAGRHDSPVKTIGRKVDLFGDQVGDSRSIIRGKVADGITDNADLDQRNTNMIMYVTPAMGALQAAFQYVPDEDDTNNTADQTKMNIAAWYSAGPLYVGLGYGQTQNDNGAAGVEDETVTRLVGSYQMDALKVTALYQTADGLNYADNEYDAYGLGVAFNMGGGNTVKAQYYMADADGDEATMTAIGFDHAMSKQTSVYAAYAMTSNDTGLTTTPWGGTGHEDLADGVSGEDASALSVGVVHKF